MAKKTKADWLKEAEELGLDTSSLKTINEIKAAIDLVPKDEKVIDNDSADETQDESKPEESLEKEDDSKDLVEETVEEVNEEVIEEKEEPIEEDINEVELDKEDEEALDKILEESDIAPEGECIACNNEKAIELIKEQRVKLDLVLRLQEVPSLDAFDKSDRVFLAKAWLGKLLAALGTKNPYAGEEKLKSEKEIVPTQDVAVDFDKEFYQFKLLSTLEATVKLRKMIGEVISAIDKVPSMEVGCEDPLHAQFCHNQFEVNASEARFFLGDVLAQIKK